MAKHKADGLYYVTGAMLDQVKACRPKRTQFRKLYTKSSKRKIPITLDLVTTMNTDGDGTGWMIRRLFDLNKFTKAEYEAYYAALAAKCRKLENSKNKSRDKANWPKVKAKLAMDIVLQRAKRERLV